MSKSPEVPVRCARTTRRLPSLAVCAALTLLAQTAHAQTAAELRVRHDSLTRRMGLAVAALDTAENRARAVPDDSVVLHGAVLRFRAVNLAERDRLRLIAAFDEADAELQRIFGADGATLMAGQVWQVTVSNVSRDGVRDLGLEAFEGTQRVAGISSRIPLNEAAVKRAILSEAGRKLVRKHPNMSRWLGGSFSFPDPTTVHYVAHRELALHPSGIARACVTGNVAACREILDPPAPTESGESEARLIATSAVPLSLMSYAIGVDAPAILRAFQSATDSTLHPLEFLSAAGQPTEQLLSGWQREISAAGEKRVTLSAASVFTAVGWFSLCGFLATRRRPR